MIVCQLFVLILLLDIGLIKCPAYGLTFSKYDLVINDTDDTVNNYARNTTRRWISYYQAFNRSDNIGKLTTVSPRNSYYRYITNATEASYYYDRNNTRINSFNTTRHGNHNYSSYHIPTENPYNSETDFYTAQTFSNVSEETYRRKARLPLVSLGAKSYYVENILRANFDEAMYYCKSHNMQLLSLETKDEIPSIKKILATNNRKMGSASYFTSAKYFSNGGYWVWIDSGRINSEILPRYHDVYYEQPRDECLALEYDFKNKTISFRTSNCDTAIHVICFVIDYE